MAKKIRVYELARELGLSNKECLDLCESLGIGVKSHSSSMEDAHADRARRKAVREGLVREAPPEEEKPAEPEDAKPKPVVSSKKPPPGRPDAGDAPAEDAPAPAAVAPPPPPVAAPAAPAPDAPAPTAPPAAPAAPSAPVAPVAATPPPPPAPAAPPKPPSDGRRMVTSSGSSGPIRPRPEDVPAPAAAAPPTAPPAERAPAKPKPPPGPAPAQPRTPGEVPLSPSGKPIPPPPAPRSLSGKPIPPPPGRGGRGAAPARPSGPPRRGAGGGPGGPRPGGGPGGGGPPRPGGGPGRGGGRGPQRPPRRRKSRRRRRSLDELRPAEVPTYTPEGAPVPSGLIIVERHSTPQEIASKLGRTAADVVRFLLTNGEMVTATESLSDELIEMFAGDIGAEIRLVDLGEEQEEEMRGLLEVPDFDEDDDEEDDSEDDDHERVSRAPVITVMGHVDHGKTKLLDRIRNANVVDGEAGGITQHIGAYQTEHNGQPMTFIDTPGHEAFTAIRARGADATDIVILVVAADDGVMPQTVEAINHAKAADVPIVVAMNKMDREAANPEKVLSELAERNLVPEAWGGDTIVMPISALEGTGIEELLDQLLLVAEVEELTAVMDTRAMGVVLESNLSVGRGPVSTLLVQHGVLKVGEPCVAGAAWGRVRALINDQGEQIKEAGPSTPVEVLGLSDVAAAGDEFIVAQNEKVAGKVADSRTHWRKVQELSSRDSESAPSSGRLEDLFAEIEAGKAANLNLIVKADAHGSLEALVSSLKRLNRPDVKLSIVHSGVGGLTENDITLGTASESIIIAFNVRPDRKARALAATEGVEIRSYEIIYKVLEDIEAAMLGMLTPEVEEVVTGDAEVREIFRIKGVGLVAGCMVQSGVIKRNDKVRFLREGTVIWKGTLKSLRRFTEDATEVRAGFECGVGLSDFQDLVAGDIIETYEDREIPIT